MIIRIERNICVFVGLCLPINFHSNTYPISQSIGQQRNATTGLNMAG